MAKAGWVLKWGWPSQLKPVESFEVGMKAWGELSMHDHWGASLVWEGSGEPPDLDSVDVFACDKYLEEARGRYKP